MKEVINIIQERIGNAKKQIAFDIEVKCKEPYHKKRIENNQIFIAEANKAIDILTREAGLFKRKGEV